MEMAISATTESTDLVNAKLDRLRKSLAFFQCVN